MRASTKIAIGTLVGFALGVVLSYLVVLDFRANGFIASHYATFLGPPRSATKLLALLAAVLVFAALPFGIAEWRADARFRREERRLREERPAAEVTEYEGPEGHGLRFADAEGAVLLLRPSGGLSAPVLVHPEPPEAAAPTPGNVP